MVAGNGHEECQPWLAGLCHGGLSRSVQAPGAEADGAAAVWVERAFLQKGSLEVGLCVRAQWVYSSLQEVQVEAAGEKVVNW